jgi:hypothetical protein
MEKYLEEQLQVFTAQTKNDYRDNWGSVMHYIEDTATVLGEEIDPTKLFELQE